ncbi:MAG: DUF4097 family beta strand repeat-containing protein [Vicinamibacterales bacterium]
MMHIRLVMLSASLGTLVAPAGTALAAPRPHPVEARPAADADPPPDTPLERYLDARQGPEETDNLVREFTVGATGALDLSNISGDVQVNGSNGSAIRIEATRRVRHRDAGEARRLLDQLRVEMTQVGDRVEVRTVYPRRGERGTSARVDYVITVPARAAVAVKTISGDSRVERVSGEVRAESVSGDVRVTATPNVALAKTVSGNVTARDIGGASSLSLGSVSGNVVATGVKARSLDCGSVSGDIQLSGVEVERLQAKSVSGDLEFAAALARGGRYEFGSHSGDVRVVLGSDTGFELDASTFSGSVRSDFPVTLRSDGSSRNRRGASRSVRGSYGDASAILAIQTFSGSVVISRK